MTQEHTTDEGCSLKKVLNRLICHLAWKSEHHEKKEVWYSGGNGNRGEIGFAYFLAILPFYENSCI